MDLSDPELILSPDSVGLLGGVIHDLLHVFGHHSQRLNEWSSASSACVGFYLSFTDWSAMIHGETATYRFWLTMVDDELLCIVDRPSWKSKESKTAQQWLSQSPKSPPVININHVSLKSFKCFRNYNGAASEHTTLAIIWLPVVLNRSKSELSRGCFNLQGLDGRILEEHLCRDKIRCYSTLGEWLDMARPLQVFQYEVARNIGWLHDRRFHGNFDRFWSCRFEL